MNQTPIHPMPPGRRETVTNGGAIMESTRTDISWADDTTYWATWSQSCAGYTIRTWIELARWTPNGWRTWVEGGWLTRADCPLEFLDRVPPGDRDWRDRVWAHHEEQLAHNYPVENGEPCHAD